MSSLELVTTAEPDLEVSLRDGGQQLDRRRLNPVLSDVDRVAWKTARDALDRHEWALGLERAATMPGVLPLPPDHVPAAEHFMVAVHALFPGYAASS